MDSERKNELLVQILAEIDAVFTPQRTWTRPLPTVLYERRRDYPTLGVRWMSGKATEAGRKQIQRDLEELVDGGFAVSCRPKNVKTLGVRLTDFGEAYARALCGMDCLGFALEAVATVNRLADHPDAAGAGCVCEDLITEISHHEVGLNPDLWSQYLAMETIALPALVRGWMRSNSDIKGRVWYWLTDTGKSILENPPTWNFELPDEVPGMYKAWDDALVAAQKVLAAAKPQQPRELGYIPIPVSLPRHKDGNIA